MKHNACLIVGYCEFLDCLREFVLFVDGCLDEMGVRDELAICFVIHRHAF